MRERTSFEHRGSFPIRAIIYFVAVLCPFQAIADEPRNTPNRWLTDFSAAQAEAKRLDRPLLVHFYADWCLPCKRMEREVLNDAELLKQFGSKFIAVRVDADQNETLLEKFHIQTLPADVFVAPDGKVLAQMNGFQTRRLYLLRLALVDAQFSGSNTTDERIADNPIDPKRENGTDNYRPLIVARPTSQSRNVPGPTSVDAVISMPKLLVGLDGFSPVSLYARRKWWQGNVEFAASYKGIQYWMVTAQELTDFREAPQRYVPRLLGCDPVVLQETDRALNGSTHHAAYFDGELFLFVSAQSREKFKQNPLRYTRTRHVLRLDKNERTRIR